MMERITDFYSKISVEVVLQVAGYIALSIAVGIGIHIVWILLTELLFKKGTSVHDGIVMLGAPIIVIVGSILWAQYFGIYAIIFVGATLIGGVMDLAAAN